MMALNPCVVYKPCGYEKRACKVEGDSMVDGMFAERFLELCQERFATLYRRVSERFWNNSVYGYVKRAYYMCRFDIGVAGYHVPTTVNGEGFPQENYIAIAVLPELDQQIFDEEVKRLSRPLSPCLGLLDSITIFVVAPKASKEQRRRLAGKPWKERLNLFLKNRRMGNIFAYPIICSSPEIAFKKLMDRLVNFWKKRVKGFLDSLKIQPYQYDYREENLLSNTYNSICRVLENYDRQIVHCLRSMVAHFVYFRDGLREAMRAIGSLNMLKNRAFNVQRRLNVALDVLEPKTREQVVSKLEEILLLTCVTNKPPPKT